MLVTHALGEFGDTSCACEDLQARLETVDWTGSGTGLRFESLKISDLRPPDPYDDYVPGGSTRSGGIQGELIVRRFEATELLSRIPPIVSWSDDPTYQIDQTVLRVNEDLGQITLNSTNDVDATIDTVDRIAGELGEAERPAQPGPTLRQRIITALGPTKGLALSLSLGLLSSIWLGLRVLGVVRRRPAP